MPWRLRPPLARSRRDRRRRPAVGPSQPVGCVPPAWPPQGTIGRPARALPVARTRRPARSRVGAWPLARNRHWTAKRRPRIRARRPPPRHESRPPADRDRARLPAADSYAGRFWRTIRAGTTADGTEPICGLRPSLLRDMARNFLDLAKGTPRDGKEPWLKGAAATRTLAAAPPWPRAAPRIHLPNGQVNPARSSLRRRCSSRAARRGPGPRVAG